MKVVDILKRKGTAVITVRSDQTVREGIEQLVTHGVGCLLVVDGPEKIAGILTERDILRANARLKEECLSARISEVMTQKVIIGLEDDTVDSVMGLMTERRIRHLPIMSKGRLAGILSIGDIVKALHHEAAAVIRTLEDYIAGKYPS